MLDAKLSPAGDAAENTPAEESGIPESAENVNGKRPSSAVHSTTDTFRLTIAQAKRRLIDWFKSQIGYHEAPDGSNKYADGIWDVRLYGFDARTVPWCDIFVDKGFITVFGYENGTAMTYQQPSGYAACKKSAETYMENRAWYNIPAPGDQIFFYYSGDINHTGLVIEVCGDIVVCVEGNYSNSVARTQYNWKTDRIIAGFGRPNWSLVADAEAPAVTVEDFSDVDDTQFDIIHPENRRTLLHLEYGSGNGNPLPQVKAWQNLLLCWGIDVGPYGADGEFMLDTENATLKWQQEMRNLGADIEVNGVVDEDDWEQIIRVTV